MVKNKAAEQEEDAKGGPPLVTLAKRSPPSSPQHILAGAHGIGTHVRRLAAWPPASLHGLSALRHQNKGPSCRTRQHRAHPVWVPHGNITAILCACLPLHDEGANTPRLGFLFCGPQPAGDGARSCVSAVRTGALALLWASGGSYDLQRNMNLWKSTNTK